MTARRIYLGRAAEVFCLVDEVDYEWATQWRWGFTFDRTKRKMYATRMTRLHGRAGPQTKVYLHKAILERAGLTPPSTAHTIGDHEDGDSLNNQRDNLRWATTVQNRRNRRPARARHSEIEQAADVPF